MYQCIRGSQLFLPSLGPQAASSLTTIAHSGVRSCCSRLFPGQEQTSGWFLRLYRKEEAFPEPVFEEDVFQSKTRKRSHAAAALVCRVPLFSCIGVKGSERLKSMRDMLSRSRCGPLSGDGYPHGFPPYFFRPLFYWYQDEYLPFVKLSRW